MSRILAISSQVARGSVGLSIIVPALQALGHEVIGLPTVVLSNHPGHPHVSGLRIDPDFLQGMLAALDRNGWLADVEAVLTGYLPTTGHVDFAKATVQLIADRRGGTDRVFYACDPVLGDDPKGLYIETTAAEAVRGLLVPLADIITPNRFELSFLAERDVRSVDEAVDAAGGLTGGTTFATSVPAGDSGQLANVLCSDDTRAVTLVHRRDCAPHGTGDLFAALALSAWLDGPASDIRPDAASTGYATTAAQPADVLAFATAGVDFALDGSLDPEVLSPSALPLAATPLSWPVQPLRGNGGGTRKRPVP